MDGYTALLFHNGGLSDVLLPILVLFGMSIVLFNIGIWRFKYD